MENLDGSIAMGIEAYRAQSVWAKEGVKPDIP